MDLPLRAACRALPIVAALLVPLLAGAQEVLDASPLIPTGTVSGLPLVAPNDNTVPAGVQRGNVREISLEVVRADWRIETSDGPGLQVAAVAEEGALPSIPSPLIRAEEGTRVRVSVRNRLDRPVKVFGLHTRNAGEVGEPLTVGPGGRAETEFDVGSRGTYRYWLEEVLETEVSLKGVRRPPERQQLAGALVVDPAGGSPPDRILVLNIFTEPVDRTNPDGPWLEALAINGRSWPHTERMALEVGETARWRVVNASIREHPMHLHGFFFDVLSRGDAAGDTLYTARDRRTVVTESMLPGTTMLMEWTPTRPGRWLFHCHLSFHVTGHLRLPGAADLDPPGSHNHMAGLVMGIEVAPGSTDLVATETVTRDLYANEYGSVQGFRYGFALEPDFPADSLTDAPGPVLVFHRYQAAEVTVRNTMSIPTGVHWHGLELDAWSDGVPDWSASDGRVSPVIPPGEAFTYRLSFLRPGTFIYHSHLDDIDQLTGGLYGPLVVLPEGEVFDPRTDHPLVWGWNTPNADGPEDMDLNGRREQPEGRAVVGETHRFRLVNIGPAGMISAWITRDGEPVPYTLLAKDGADLPEHQRVPVESLQHIGVGETADFTWTPREPGVYRLLVGFGPEAGLSQRWVVEGQPDR